jgi:hypothetical protein
MITSRDKVYLKPRLLRLKPGFWNLLWRDEGYQEWSPAYVSAMEGSILPQAEITL